MRMGRSENASTPARPKAIPHALYLLVVNDRRAVRLIMIVTRIVAADGGAARMERREVPMQPDRSGRATSADFPALRLFFRDTPPAHVHEKHRAPQRQFIFVVSGIAEIELDDGTRRRF